MARLFDWTFIAVTAVVAAALVFDAANTSLKEPMQQVEAALKK